jgi:hypothetical protein
MKAINMAKCVALAFLALILASGGIARADTRPASLFDPARHMRISEIKPGMKGYGLTVFSGTKIEKFDVVVVDVIKNFNPKYDVILIRCPQEYLTNTGPIEGMSGSPIFLYDGSGKARMAGAFAYGWAFSKDCLAGVQPIEYMLELPTNHPPESPGIKNSTAEATSSMSSGPRWSLNQIPLRPWGRSTRFRGLSGDRPISSAGAMNMRPLATPLMTGGASTMAMARIAPLFADSGLIPMQAGNGVASADGQPAPKLEPGSVLAVPLLDGDMQLTAVGTCTERIGDQIFGFGHSFNNEGPIELPVGSGSIAAIVSNVQTSFKLGFISGTAGALMTDETVGVAGLVGKTAPMAPLEFHIVYDDGSEDQTYHFTVALHPKLTPLIIAAAGMMAMSGEKNLPEYHTVDYKVTETFADGHVLHVNNTSVNGDGTEIVSDIILPLMATSDNPFAYVPMTGLTATFHVAETARAAEILSVMVPQTKYAPGDTVKASISYLPFHADEAILPVEFDLPHDLADGEYQLIVSDWERYLEDEKTANPFKFTAENIGELFSVLKDLGTLRHDAVFLRLVRQADGVAVGHTEMPHLPPSRMQVMLDSGRSDITPFVTSTVKIAPAGLVMSGSADFTIDVERQGKVETPATQPSGE